MQLSVEVEGGVVPLWVLHEDFDDGHREDELEVLLLLRDGDLGDLAEADGVARDSVLEEAPGVDHQEILEVLHLGLLWRRVDDRDGHGALAGLDPVVEGESHLRTAVESSAWGEV